MWGGKQVPGLATTQKSDYWLLIAYRTLADFRTHTQICKDNRFDLITNENVRYWNRVSELSSSAVHARWMINRELKENAHPGWSWLSVGDYQNAQVRLSNANREQSFLSTG